MGAWIISSWQIAQVRPLITAVLLNIALTLSIWIFVYGTETDKDTKAFYLFDSNGNFTTGDDIYDGLLNGFICLISLATLSFLMLAFALYDFRRLLQFWLIVSCLLINFLISASLHRDILNACGFHDASAFVLVVFPTIYGIVGCVVFFTNRLPAVLHQFYVICNCAMVSLFYLRTFPNQTTWFVLAGIIVWDLFAVLTPFGPLRRITEKANDYSEIVLRLLMFDVKTYEEAHTFEDYLELDVNTARTFSPKNLENSSQSDGSSSEKMEFSEENELSEQEIIPPSRTAYDALQDGSITRLGMGDFVFYSLLVGKAAVSGSVFATLAAVVGVVVGLVITLTMLPDYEDSIPALPVSIFLGIFLHFSTLFVLEPLFGVMLAVMADGINYLASLEVVRDYLYVN